MLCLVKDNTTESKIFPTQVLFFPPFPKMYSVESVSIPRD